MRARPSIPELPSAALPLLRGRAGIGAVDYTASMPLPPLLPRPRKLVSAAGTFSLRESTPLLLGRDADDDDFRSALALRDAIAEHCGLHLAIESHAHARSLGPHIALSRSGAGAAPGDGYRVAIDPRAVRLGGDGPAGLRYAVETTAQLIDSRGRLPACRIEDAPDFALRGILLDVSRGKVPTLESLFGLVDRMVRLKLNVLMLYTEHTFQWRRHPEIGADASPLCAEDVRRLDAYAAERHVDLIPTLQALGHMSHVLKHPRYAQLAESKLGWSLSPAEPGTYELLDDLLAEYLPNFRSRWYNANCDEPWDLGRGKSKDREQQLGPGGVYLEHVAWLRAAAREYGKRTMIWGDVVHRHPERLRDIPKDLVMLDWWYEAECDFDRVRAFAEGGIDFVVCPGTSSWNCLFPRVENSLRNIERWAAAGRRHGALGLVNTDWGDFGHYNLQGGSWLAYAWGAQQAWSGEVAERDFDRAFGRVFFGEARGAAAACYRALGAVHEPGFRVPNGSALQYLFFDALPRGFFVRQATLAGLRRCARRLEAASRRIDAARDSFGHDRATWNELRWAADASRYAVDKALAGFDWVRWQTRPDRLDARGRRALARRLLRLADRQRTLGRELRHLWNARSRPSNFEITQRRLGASIRGLRAAARTLERNAPPPVPAADATGLGDIFRELRENAER